MNLTEIKNGKIFTVDFVKKDGTPRTMNARCGVSKGVKGVGRKFDPAERGYLSVYDMTKRGYRLVDIESIKEIRANGKIYKP